MLSAIATILAGIFYITAILRVAPGDWKFTGAIERLGTIPTIYYATASWAVITVANGTTVFSWPLVFILVYHICLLVRARRSGRKEIDPPRSYYPRGEQMDRPIPPGNVVSSFETGSSSLDYSRFYKGE